MVCMAMALCVSCKKDDDSSDSGGNGGGGNTGGGTDITGTIAGHAYVDLGLPSGLLWATCNVGASKPEDYGNYYAWGETTTKSYYYWDNYKWSNGFQFDDWEYPTLTKYNTESWLFGPTVDNKTVLELADDVAHVNWGGSWRMPTIAEMEELRYNCTCTWMTQSGSNGYRVTGPNGKSIFLPAAGYYDSSLNFAGSFIYYWSSSLYTNYPSWSCIAELDHSVSYYFCRCNGLSVRPVYGSQNVSVPTVTTSSVSNITKTTATCGGEVTSDGGAAVTACGVCWSTSQNPTPSDNCTVDGEGVGAFTSEITGLEPGTKYYVRAYAKNAAGTGFGEQKSFTTLGNGGGGGTIAGHDYVDLGLPSGLLWATCNVGADKPEDYGSYFAWGETTPKSDYNWSTYKWCNGSETTLTKYNTDSYYGIVDNKTVLDPEDDAARANWGGAWRMPTNDEMKELKDNCTREWTTQNSVNGYRVTGPNGKSIFLPAAGYFYNVSLYNAGSRSGCWSSSLDTDYPSIAYGLSFRSVGVFMGRYGRDYGLSVRPVCSSQK